MRASRSVLWVEGRLQEGGAGGVWVEHRGFSMAPTLRDGDRLRVLPLGAEMSDETGEIVLARRGERLVAHRLLSVAPPIAITRGDGCRADDPPLPRRALLGRVVEVERRGRRFAPGRPGLLGRGAMRLRWLFE